MLFVFQNSKLFKMSLRDNLLIGKPDATNEEIDNALINSGSKDIIKNLDKGLDTVYGTKGTYFFRRRGSKDFYSESF